MRRGLWAAAALALALLLAAGGCAREEPVRVGSKFFAENQILAEMMAALAARQGVPVEKTVPFGNTFALQQAVRKGNLDLYPEYTGTGAVMLGAAVPPEPEETLAAVRRLFDPLGLVWLDPLGFNNNYVLVLRPDKAQLWEAETIGDLAQRDEPLTVAAAPEFLQRAVDGMASLVRRYGFAAPPETLAVDDREGLYRRLLAGEADVVVGHRTDPQIAEYGLTVLADDLDFFPVYQAAPLVSRRVLEAHPALARALDKLAGRLDAATMRRLNSRVEQQGLAPREVALDWLVRQGLLDARPPRPYQKVLVVSAPPMDDTPPSTARGLEAMRQVFPDRPVKLDTVALPAESLRQGWAFVAVLGAEHFFERGAEGLRPVGGIEAVAPLGFRLAHLLVPRGRADGRGGPFAGIRRLGVGPEHGSSQRVARFLADAYGAEEMELVAGEPQAQAEEVASGGLDALLVMAPQGDSGVITLLTGRRLALRSLGDWGKRDRQHRYPFFRLSRIPAGAYPGQERRVETVGAQVVLAGPRPGPRALGGSAPVGAVGSARQALPDALKLRLARAMDANEAIDPSLPGDNLALVRQAPEPAQPLNPDPRASWLIAGFLAALAAFFVLLARARSAPGPTRPPRDPQGGSG
jgi:glycine betaine/choline ABC-type transport system substrate-binding protein